MAPTNPAGTSDGPILANDLTKDDYARLAAERAFVLPVGILEEHGPHLPLGTDTFQAEAVTHAAAERTGAVVLPTLSYGNCHSTRPFPGSISLSFDTMRTITAEILAELARHGVAGVAIVSGHAGGGHMRALKMGARDVLKANPGMRIAVLSEWEILFGLDPGDLPGELEIPSGDGHAGTMETARIQHLHPELVRDTPGEHTLPDEGFILDPNPGEIWPDGYAGDPSTASAKLGEALHDVAVDALEQLLTELTPDPSPVL